MSLSLECFRFSFLETRPPILEDIFLKKYNREQYYYTMDHEVVARSCKSYNWLLNLVMDPYRFTPRKKM